MLLAWRHAARPPAAQGWARSPSPSTVSAPTVPAQLLSPLPCRPGGFDPERFSVAEAQRALEAALASRASVSMGAKQFCMPMAAVGGLPLWGDG